MPVMPAVDDTLTMEPPPACRMGSITLLMPHQVPNRLTRTVFSKVSKLSWSIEAGPK